MYTVPIVLASAVPERTVRGSPGRLGPDLVTGTVNMPKSDLTESGWDQSDDEPHSEPVGVMMVSEQLARRFLHVNLNCGSLDATEGLYVGRLGLSARMRSDPDAPTDGDMLGIEGGDAYCATSFLYDARGGRAGCALEAVQFTKPGMVRDPSADPVRPGIRSALMTVADLEVAAASLRDDGFTIGEPVEGLISGEKALLTIDPDGAVLEIAQAPGDMDPDGGALFSGIRIAAINLVETGRFLTAIGFSEINAPVEISVSGRQLVPNGSPDAVDCLVARYGLPEDAHQFTVTVVQHPDTKPEPVPWGGNRQGLYRCALRVESVAGALADLPDWVERKGDPVWCPLPGTKIEGLYIAFLNSPDGVVFEFVERPLAHFR